MPMSPNANYVHSCVEMNKGVGEQNRFAPCSFPFREDNIHAEEEEKAGEVLAKQVASSSTQDGCLFLQDSWPDTAA